MKRFLITLFLLVDFVVLVGATLFLFYYLQEKPLPIPAELMPVRLPLKTKAAPTVSNSTTVPAPLTSTASPTGFIPPIGNPVTSGFRNLRFTYKSSKAKEVSIRADFTGWRAKPMIKDAAGTWMFDVQLAPGEYAYCYAVDSKIIPDPAAKKTKRIGQNTVSAIEVKPAPPK